MARSHRDIFNDHVAALARRFGVHLDRLADGERRRLLNDVRRRNLNEHEAAMTVAYAYLMELPEHDLEHARVLLDRLGLVGRQWREEALVDAALVEPLERAARARLREMES